MSTRVFTCCKNNWCSEYNMNISVKMGKRAWGWKKACWKRAWHWGKGAWHCTNLKGAGENAIKIFQRTCFATKFYQFIELVLLSM